ncbi:MAG: heavy metal translocating P-type ATPase [Bacteroidia bacterium]|nr:heavy metal translocating P-type ATPase [Bacteroidia bacterium]
MSSNRKISLPILGMSCATCAINVESMLKAQDGVAEASVSYAGNTVFVEYDPDKVSVAQLSESVKSIGYELLTEDVENEELERMEKVRFLKLRTRLIVSAIFTAPVFVMAMFFHHAFGSENLLMLILSVPVLAWCGQEFFVNAYRQAQHRKTNMDTLVALGTGITFIYSTFNAIFPGFMISRGLESHVYFESATMIITLILTGRFLEERAKTSASAAIRKLMSLQPDTLTVIRDGKELTIPARLIEVNDIVKVRPGEKVSVDGLVISGGSYVDESMLTGESFPVNKTPGSNVFAGTLNQDGVLNIQTLKTGKETYLSQIIRMVQEAQSGKPPVQKLVDRIASVFVPVVLLLALLTFVIWTIAGPEPKMTYAFLTMISVLIVACPCALGLATPTALIAGIGKAAESGILIRDVESLEAAGKTEVVVFDKTGTITEGKPVVSECEIFDKPNLANVRDLLYSIESQSDHPLANAVADYLKNTHAIKSQVEQFENMPGRGVKAVIDDRWYFAGSRRLMEENNIQILGEAEQFASKPGSEAGTLVWFSDNKKVLAVFAITDPARESAKRSVEELKKMGIEVSMLTGDNRQAASEVAAKAGITSFRAEMLPHEKISFIEELQRQGKIVAMVGDGINDSAALAKANIGIAMASGSDIAMESAGMTLMNSNLYNVVNAIRLSKLTVRTIRQNLFWAFFYNIIAIPIAAGALFPLSGFLLSPMIAGGAMAFSSVSVVTNSLRLRRVKLSEK